MTDINLFNVETDYQPNSIKLTWQLSGTLLSNEHVIICRAITTYPTTPEEGTVVYDSTSNSVTSFQDLSLENNRYFYYTIFIKDTVTEEFTDPVQKTQGFALAYQNWNSSEDVYNLFPEETRSYDEQTTGDLKRLCSVMGNLIDLYRSEVFVTEYNRKPDKAPDNILDFFSESFGFPAERAIDLNVLRRIGEGIVSIYKRKGTIPAIKNFIKLFTEFDSKILETDIPNFKLYDETSKLYSGTLTSTGSNFATDTSQTWIDNQWIRGTFQDQEQSREYTINSNNVDTLQLSNAPPVIAFDSGTTGGGVDDSLMYTASNITPVTGTAQSGHTDQLVDTALNIYPDNYWNMSYCIITSGTNIGQRQFIKSFDSQTGTIMFDGNFSSPISNGTTYSLERYLHIFLSGVTGFAMHELAGRTLTVTAGTNSGQGGRIARNWEFGGSTYIVMSSPFTEVIDNTSDLEISLTGLLFQDTSKSWTIDEWNGYKITIAGTDTFNIVSNTTDTLVLSPIYKNQGSPQTLQFFNVYDNYPTQTYSYDIDNKYFVADGFHAFMHNDLVPDSYIGTSKDYGQFLFGGTVRSISTVGGVGEFELPIIILNEIETSGRSSDLSMTVLTDLTANFPVNGYVGYKLNPNDQQLFDFTIVSNTATTITVIGNLTLVSQIGNNYYVINKIGSTKTKRLTQIIPQFIPYNLRPIIKHELS